jgi:hypothetical protein
MSGVVSRVVAACAAGVVVVAVAGGPAFAAGPGAVVAHPGLARPAGGLAPIPPPGSFFRIHNFEFGKCIGISGAPPDGQAGDWNCTTNPDQTWSWGDPFPGTFGAYRQLVNGRGQCLGVAGGSDQQGAMIVGWTCLGTDHFDQYWESVPNLPEGQPSLINFDNGGTGVLIGVQGASSANGANLVLWTDTGHPDQQWLPF